MRKNKRFEREQGDINTTPNRRKYWEQNLSGPTKKWFEEDAQYFLHQSLSTPVINVLSRAHGIYIEDLKPFDAGDKCSFQGTWNLYRRSER
jgi:4-aminobutyrate aminotransferase